MLDYNFENLIPPSYDWLQLCNQAYDGGIRVQSCNQAYDGGIRLQSCNQAYIGGIRVQRNL